MSTEEDDYSQSGSETEDSTSSEEEDDKGNQLTDNFEKCFFKTLSSLKSKDPSIYDSNTLFFDAPPIAPIKKKKEETPDEKSVFVKDYERKIITDDDIEEGCSRLNKNNNKLSYVEEQKQLKDGFKKFLNDSDESDSDGGGILNKHIKTDKEIQEEEADYIQWLKGQKEELADKETEIRLKPLQEFWSDNKLDKDEEFLKDYMLNKRYLEKEVSDEEVDGAVSEDSETYAEMEQFEQDYNLRFENDEAAIRRYPRSIEGSLRRKDDRRKKKRKEIRERKGKEKLKKVEEINRLKKMKAEEISQTLEKLKELTGNEKLAFKEQDIMEDFNPEEHDKKMSEMFDNDFYSNAETIKPDLGDEGDYEFENNFEDGEDFNMDCDAVIHKKEKKKTRTKLKKERKKMSFVEQMKKEKPVFDPELHNTFDNYMEDYYKLDCEDFIGDLPCRFKYRSVEPNSFGLTVEEILAADDADLNKWSSMSRVEKIRPNHVEKNDAKMYSEKAKNLNLKKKLMPSLFKTEDSSADVEGPSTSAMPDASTSAAVDQEDEANKKSQKKQWKKSKGQKFLGKCQNKNKTFHDSRLSAYGINPKKFKHKNG